MARPAGTTGTKKTKNAKLKSITSTDMAMSAQTACSYYGLCFQVEFLIRDAKSCGGLEHCQTRSKQKLHHHFNIAMTAVSVARASYYLPLPEKKRKEGFSMIDVKMIHMNELPTNRFFYNLGLGPGCEKYKQAMKTY